jgi:uncharacterized protein YggE
MLIEQPWGISAYGTGTVDTEPDHAVVRVAVNRTNTQPDAALEATRQAVAAVRQSLRERGVPDSKVTSSRTSVQSSWDGYGPERRFVGHQCRAEFSIRVDDLDAVEPVVVDLVAAGADEVLGVDYDTSRADELRTTARERAVAAARSRASEFATAAGITLGPVVHIEDVDAGPSPIMYRLAAAPPGADAGTADFAPGQLTVSTSVALGFAINR